MEDVHIKKQEENAINGQAKADQYVKIKVGHALKINVLIYALKQNALRITDATLRMEDARRWKPKHDLREQSSLFFILIICKY